MVPSRDGRYFHNLLKIQRSLRVTLSIEGSKKLQPRQPLDGWVQGVEADLVIVLEANGSKSHYHPDFLEPA